MATGGVVETLRDGVLLCRRNKWRQGYDRLARVAALLERKGNLPGIYYSYLGLAMAKCEGRKRDGMKLCRYAVDHQPMQPDNHVNLGWIYVMIGNRRSAWKCLRMAQQLVPDHERAAELHDELGLRREPVVGFLGRTNPVNRAAGLVASLASTDDDENDDDDEAS